MLAAEKPQWLDAHLACRPRCCQCLAHSQIECENKTVNDFPSLPPGGLGILALSASFSLVALVLALVANLLKKRWIDTIWSVVPPILLSLTMIFGSRAPSLHAAISVIALAIIFRNAIFFEGVARWASVVSAAACTNAVAVAIWLF
jgi:hypothetical protein